ncbi:hypothetical protein [Mycobacterium sp.]|uniref:hypothetical protein n=1 Tax=Mycobacterium sp. TaxID=1785 RepID=UPI003BB0BF1B
MEQAASADPDVHEFRISGRLHHVTRIEKVIVALQKRGVAHLDIDPRTTAGALVAMLASYVYWAPLDDSYDEDLDGNRHGHDDRTTSLSSFSPSGSP